MNIDSDISLLGTSIDLFAAGTDTTTTTLLWAFIYLMRYPDVQEKLIQEIDEVIGNHRPPCWKDRNNMPFTEAFLNEVSRIATIIPLGLFHKSSNTVKVCGKRIPAGSWLTANVYNLHHSVEYWNKPNAFDPGRFLEMSQASSLMPFGTGVQNLNNNEKYGLI